MELKSWACSEEIEVATNNTANILKIFIFKRLAKVRNMLKLKY
jgi:hypothetical protein